MRAKVRAVLIGATASAALATAGPAFGATTYCVHQTGTCAAGEVDEGPDLQQALTDAAAGDSTVLVGPGLYTGAGTGFSMSTVHNVTVTGAGRGQTLLSAAGSSISVMSFFGSAGSTLSSMSLVVDSHASEGLYIDTATARDVEGVLAASAADNAVGAEPHAGATIRDSTFEGGPNAGGAGVKVVTAVSPLLDHDIISGYYGVYDDGAPVKLQRSTLSGKYPIYAVSAGSDLVADDDLVLVGSETTFGISVFDGGSATVRSTTVAGTAAGGHGVESVAFDPGTHSTLSLLNSIVWNVDNGLLSFAGSGQTSSIIANYDDIDGTASATGTGAALSTSNSIKADPLFVNAAAGDYRLRFGSPAIDSGSDCVTTCLTVPDLAGLTRPIDGNGDGAAVRDMGAFEYARQAPSAIASVDRASALTGELVAFSGAGSSDPDPGDALTYAWSFDDGAAASGQAVTHAFMIAGPHTATLTVTDPTGLSATAAAIVTVAAPLVVKDTVAPTLSKVSLSPPTFAIARGSTAVSAKLHRGTSIHFTLSEAAKVVATLERRATGVRSGKHCVAKSRKHRQGKACTRYVRAGTLTRRSEPAGADAIAFTGRLGRHRLASGRYRMRLRATDAAGNRSHEKTASFRIV